MYIVNLIVNRNLAENVPKVALRGKISSPILAEPSDFAERETFRRISICISREKLAGRGWSWSKVPAREREIAT